MYQFCGPTWAARKWSHCPRERHTSTFTLEFVYYLLFLVELLVRQPTHHKYHNGWSKRRGGILCSNPSSSREKWFWNQTGQFRAIMNRMHLWLVFPHHFWWLSGGDLFLYTSFWAQWEHVVFLNLSWLVPPPVTVNILKLKILFKFQS